MKRFTLSLALFTTALTFALSGTAMAAWKTESAGGFSQVHIYTPSKTASPIGSGRSLMIVLHGCTQSASAFKTAKLDAAADQYGMVIAAPEAQYKAGFLCWDYWNTVKSRTSRDYKNLIDLATTLKGRSDMNIDAAQVYIAGLSSGGAFAMQTGCLAPDVFAGMVLVGAPSAGTSSNGAFSHESSYSQTAQRCKGYAGSYASHFDTQLTISAAGTSDFTVPQAYGPQNAKAMATIYGISINPVQVNAITKAKESLYAQNRVSQLELTGEGHAWPGGAGASGSYIGSASINLGVYAAKFLSENSVRATGSNNGGDNGGDDDTGDNNDGGDTGDQVDTSCASVTASAAAHVAAGLATSTTSRFWWTNYTTYKTTGDQKSITGSSVTLFIGADGKGYVDDPNTCTDDSGDTNDGGTDDGVDNGDDNSGGTTWTCTESTSSNYAHIQAGRAQVCNSWYACATGSGESLGLNNIFSTTTLAQTADGYYEKGSCY
jgi:poly(hydroxyalkanoate) depolymerase family esterase